MRVVPVLVFGLLLGACGTAASEPDVTDTASTAAPVPTLVSSTVATTSTSVTTSTGAATVPPPPPWSVVPAGELSILFVGNSHTSTHGIPATVEMLLESIEGTEVSVETLKTGFLRMALSQSDITEALSSGEWDIVILQGHEISMSHSTTYSQDESVALARLAIESGSRPIFFAEWRQEGVDETAYIEDIYSQMAAKAGAEVLPIGRSWDRFLADHPDYPLWSDDGNHSSPDGAFLAAATIAYYLAGPEALLTTAPELQTLLEPARLTIQDYVK